MAVQVRVTTSYAMHAIIISLYGGQLCVSRKKIFTRFFSVQLIISIVVISISL